jgi:hypothetical protein
MYNLNDIVKLTKPNAIYYGKIVGLATHSDTTTYAFEDIFGNTMMNKQGYFTPVRESELQPASIINLYEECDRCITNGIRKYDY